MRLGIRQKLVLLSLLILIVISFGFTALHLWLSGVWFEEDLQARAIIFAREIAATIGDRQEFESGPQLALQIRRIMGVRRNVLQLDVLAFDTGRGTRMVATSQNTPRLPFTRHDGDEVRKGRVLSHLVWTSGGRYWEVMAPIVLEGEVVGAVAAKFSLDRADELRRRITFWALVFTAASTVVMGVLMSGAIHVVVNRPLQKFLDAIERIRAGDTQATVAISSGDELGQLARHFNSTMARMAAFNDEQEARVASATAELDRRYQEVQRLNETLFRMQRSLSHAERLALAGRIMAEVAHEVGTPLHSIAGHVELLRKDLPPALAADGAGRRLTVIDTQLQRVIEIISRLLDLTRRDPGTPAAVDVNRLVRETADLVRPALGDAGLSLALDTDAALPPVHGLATQLQQVVLNVLTNAIDASPAGGAITVTTRPRAERGEIEVAIRDAGPGIPPEHLKRIFEPFFSTKPPGKGTGLGLFIATQIVRDHRGRLEVDTAAGDGTTFRLVLPAPPAAR